MNRSQIINNLRNKIVQPIVTVYPYAIRSRVMSIFEKIIPLFSDMLLKYKQYNPAVGVPVNLVSWGITIALVTAVVLSVIPIVAIGIPILIASVINIFILGFLTRGHYGKLLEQKLDYQSEADFFNPFKINLALLWQGALNQLFDKTWPMCSSGKKSEEIRGVMVRSVFSILSLPFLLIATTFTAVQWTMLTIFCLVNITAASVKAASLLLLNLPLYIKDACAAGIDWIHSLRNPADVPPPPGPMAVELQGFEEKFSPAQPNAIRNFDALFPAGPSSVPTVPNAPVDSAKIAVNHQLGHGQ